MPGLFSRRFTAVFFCLVLPSLFSQYSIADDASLFFERGVEASKNGDFAAAVLEFELSKSAGKKSSALYYNLGVAYYKTGLYLKARDAFGMLAGNGKNASLAVYNLGLIALRLDDFVVAKHHFRKCYQTVTDKGLRSLCRKGYVRAGGALDNLQFIPGLRVKKKQKSPWSGRVSLGLSYDSNVRREEDIATEQPGSFTQINAAVGGLISGTAKKGIKITGKLYNKDYSSKQKTQPVAYDSNDYDFSQYQVGISRTDKSSTWDTRYELEYAKSTYGADDYIEKSSVRLRAKRSVNKEKYIRLSYYFSNIKGNDDPAANYEYLSGSKHNVKTDFTMLVDKHKFRFGYFAEFNDRDDSQIKKDNVGFKSYSATRNGIQVNYYYRFSKRWKLSLDGQYRRSEYNHADQISATVKEKRIDNRRRFTSRLSYRFNKEWRFSVMARYLDNSNASKRADYTQQLLGGTVYWKF